MKAAVINFSGNVGKSTVARHLLMPRIPGADLIAVESINSDEGEGKVVRGKEFGSLSEQLQIIDNAVIDVGASNVEEFVRLMKQYKGAHEDVDFFVVPVVKEGKQMRDSIATIKALSAMGVPSKKIRVVFNRVETDETDETIGDAFYPLITFLEDSKSFTLRPKAAIHYSELFDRLRKFGGTIPALIADQTDYKAQLREAKSPEEKRQAAVRISARRLAASAQTNLDEVFAALIGN